MAAGKTNNGVSLIPVKLKPGETMIKKFVFVDPI
jgi:hypothetical protein